MFASRVWLNSVLGNMTISMRSTDNTAASRTFFNVSAWPGVGSPRNVDSSVRVATGARLAPLFWEPAPGASVAAVAAAATAGLVVADGRAALVVAGTTVEAVPNVLVVDPEDPAGSAFVVAAVPKVMAIVVPGAVLTIGVVAATLESGRTDADAVVGGGLLRTIVSWPVAPLLPVPMPDHVDASAEIPSTKCSWMPASVESAVTVMPEIDPVNVPLETVPENTPLPGSQAVIVTTRLNCWPAHQPFWQTNNAFHVPRGSTSTARAGEATPPMAPTTANATSSNLAMRVLKGRRPRVTTFLLHAAGRRRLDTAFRRSTRPEPENSRYGHLSGVVGWSDGSGRCPR